jgi:hypothetical protein
MLDERSLATMLAALRYWQAKTIQEARLHDPVASDEGRIQPLSDLEIDELCELLNFSPPAQ